MRAPSKLQCIEWVKKAWESVTAEVVINSFKSCGITVKVDGSEDKEIHCIKDGGVAADAFEDISQKTLLFFLVRPRSMIVSMILLKMLLRTKKNSKRMNWLLKMMVEEKRVKKTLMKKTVMNNSTLTA